MHFLPLKCSENCSRQDSEIDIITFQRKYDITLQITWKVRFYFLQKIKKNSKYCKPFKGKQVFVQSEKNVFKLD